MRAVGTEGGCTRSCLCECLSPPRFSRCVDAESRERTRIPERVMDAVSARGIMIVSTVMVYTGIEHTASAKLRVCASPCHSLCLLLST